MKNDGAADFTKLHSPLYRVIEQNLRDRIQSGHWPPGAMLPSRKALAQEYDVDMRTIQRAVSGLLADGALNAHGGRGTFVAQATDAGGENSPGAGVQTVVIVADPSFHPGPGWFAVVNSIHEGLRRQDLQYRIVTINTADKSPESVIRHERDALKMAATEDVAGVIMFHAGGEATLPDIQRVLSAKIPVVFVDRVPFEHGCDFVGIDNRMAAREAVDYLISIGHRKIAFVAPDENVSSVQERMEGYFDARMSAGLVTSEDLVFPLSLEKLFANATVKSEVERVIDAMMALPEPPTAVFAVNDFIAEYILIALEEKGIAVPETLSVIGFDDIERFAPQKPKLTTVRQPFESIGDRAASMLIWRMNHRDNPAAAYQHVLLPTRLVARGSTREIG
ncbi:LacI family transcriptional regulator [Capsulimonas corticalis]|uniref:LacI family transcriptional regulator n=1 Tax=Capsulimonas corticalis TaxID=2219043 RepID=A0A402D6C6_9BACT|nr:GntR family transcriptional regulator [Capsulimonas corticalis]BDI32023.1 LacI family transcriptional regulator [Capsulimonas corticalis]